MGYREMGAVMECRAIKDRTHFAALVAVAYHVAGDDGLCTASKRTLAAEARLGERTLYEALAALQSDGPDGYGEPLVEVVEEGGGRGRTTSLRLNLAWLRRHGPKQKNTAGGAGFARADERETLRGPQKNTAGGADKPVIEPGSVGVSAEARARAGTRTRGGPFQHPACAAYERASGRALQLVHAEQIARHFGWPDGPDPPPERVTDFEAHVLVYAETPTRNVVNVPGILLTFSEHEQRLQSPTAGTRAGGGRAKDYDPGEAYARIREAARGAAGGGPRGVDDAAGAGGG